MSVELVRYLESLTTDEVAFLKRKETRDRRQLYRSVRILLIFCFGLPFAMAWGKAIVGVPNPFSYGSYFAGVGVLLFLTLGGATLSYRSSLYRTQLDLRRGTKTIERAVITRKRYMPQTDARFFYLDSPTRLSIEVSAASYEQLSIGDEVNIEYSTYGKAYFGYF